MSSKALLGLAALESKGRRHFAEAYKCAPDIPWLAEFARQEAPEALGAEAADSALQQQAERLAAELSRLGSTHERKFASLEKEILQFVVGSHRPAKSLLIAISDIAILNETAHYFRLKQTAMILLN